VRYLGAAIIAGLPHPRSISLYRLIDKNPKLNNINCNYVNVNAAAHIKNITLGLLFQNYDGTNQKDPQGEHVCTAI